MEQYLSGKTVLVTDAGWGIGAATAMLYAASGAKVIISDTSRKGGKDTVAKIRNQNGDATYIKADVNSAPACEKLVKSTIAIYGSLDIACNNSVIFSRALQQEDKDSKAFDNSVRLKLNGLNNCMQYEIEAMQKQGGGIIVNMSTILGAIGMARLSPYVAAKYGMADLLLNPLLHYSARGVRIIAVSPRLMNTALLENINQTEQKKLLKLSPLLRLNRIQQVADLVVWMSSHEAPLPTLLNHDN